MDFPYFVDMCLLHMCIMTTCRSENLNALLISIWHCIFGSFSYSLNVRIMMLFWYYVIFDISNRRLNVKINSTEKLQQGMFTATNHQRGGIGEERLFKLALWLWKTHRRGLRSVKIYIQIFLPIPFLWINNASFCFISFVILNFEDAYKLNSARFNVSLSFVFLQ